MKKIVIALALLLAVSLVGWYFASPGYALVQLRDAAMAGDAEALESHVDFPAVRDNLKEDLRARLGEELQGSDDGSARLGAALGMAMVDPLVDGLVTPEAIARLVEEGEVAAGAARIEQGGAGEDEAAPEWVIERDGLSRFTARPQDRETLSVAADAPTLVFEREGLGWKLVELGLPES